MSGVDPRTTLFNELFERYKADPSLSKEEAAVRALNELKQRIIQGHEEQPRTPPAAAEPGEQEKEDTRMNMEEEEGEPGLKVAAPADSSASVPAPPAAPKPVMTYTAPVAPQVKLTPTYVHAKIAECRDNGGKFGPLMTEVYNFFSNTDNVKSAFKFENEDDSIEMEQEQEMISVDLDSARETLYLLLNCGNEGVINTVCNAIKFALDAFPHSYGFSTSHDVRLFPILLELPIYMEIIAEGEKGGELNDRAQQFVVLLKGILVMMSKLTTAGKTSLMNWLNMGAGIDRLQGYARMLRFMINNRVTAGSPADALIIARFYNMIYITLNAHCTRLNTADFYCEQLNSKHIDQEIVSEYHKWIRDSKMEQSLTAEEKENRYLVEWNSFISYPFLLDPSAKARVWFCEVRIAQQMEEQAEIQQARMRGESRIHTHRLYLILSVRRDHLIEDTMNRVPFIDESDFKKELKIIFDEEDGVDAGGVRKEYYMLMMKQLLDPNFGMFKYFEESRLLWFNADCLEQPAEYEMVGILIGLAIYNNIIINMCMPSALYKKLKGQKCVLSDLQQLQPSLARGLQQLLDFEGDVEETFQFTFELSYEIFGVIRNFPLKEGGSEIKVTQKNKKEYVTLYVDYMLNKAVQTQFDAFAKGFFKVCHGRSLALFSPDELELLICGGQDLDFEELQRGTIYQDGYDKDSEPVALFWKVLHQFKEDEKRCFLKFLTGSDRCPIGGLVDIKLVVSRNTDEEERLPSAHTCFNHLLLPAYTTEEKLKERLLFAMNQTEGFGLR